MILNMHGGNRVGNSVAERDVVTRTCLGRGRLWEDVGQRKFGATVTSKNNTRNHLLARSASRHHDVRASQLAFAIASSAAPRGGGRRSCACASSVASLLRGGKCVSFTGLCLAIGTAADAALVIGPGPFAATGQSDCGRR